MPGIGPKVLDFSKFWTTMIPTTDNTFDIGSSTFKMRSIYFGTSLITPAGIAQFGTSSGSTAAVNVDASSYSNHALNLVNGVTGFVIDVVAATNVQMGTTNNNNLAFQVNAERKWNMTNDGSGISTLSSAQVTAKYIGGSTNGNAWWNSANTRANFTVADNGVTASWQSASSTYQLQLDRVFSAGDYTAGVVTLARNAGTVNFQGLFANSTTENAGIGYRDVAANAFWSAVEIFGTASGKGVLSLMKSGGNIAVGGATVVAGFAINMPSSAYIGTSSGGAIQFATEGSGVPRVSFTGNGALLGTAAGTFKHASTSNVAITPNGAGARSFIALDASYVIDATAGAQTGTVTGFTVNGTETNLNGFTHNLMDLQLASVSKFKVSSGGALTASGNILCGAAVLSTNGTSGIGYSTGAGGAVTQLTSRTTGVTLSKVAGAITLFAAAGSATAATFTVTNTAVAALDTVNVSVKSGTNVYVAVVSAVAVGSFNITFWTTGGTASDSPVFNFAVIKAVAS